MQAAGQPELEALRRRLAVGEFEARSKAVASDRQRPAAGPGLPNPRHHGR